MVNLNGSRLFSSLDPAEVEELRQAAQLRRYPAGTRIFQEGDPGDGMYVVGEGQVQIACLVGHDERRVLSTLGAGDFFGEMAILDNQNRSATATAAVETQAYFIGREEMLRVLEGSPQLAVRLVREFSLRLRDFNHRYTEEVLQAERLALVGRFARSIVHDFKNPLNIIGISAEMAALAEATPEQRESARNRIRKQVDRMSNMINELMEFTRGSTSTTVLARADFAEFVRPLLEEIRQEVGAKRVTVELASDPPAVRLLMDPRRLAHVFFNIVNNACDAMPEGGRVIVRFASNDQEVVTEIEDTGPGIAREMASRLFQPFATHGKAQGTGLGLSICRRIIEDHHGQIRACNAESGGARFTFSLPLRLESAVKV